MLCPSKKINKISTLLVSGYTKTHWNAVVEGNIIGDRNRTDKSKKKGNR